MLLVLAAMLAGCGFPTVFSEDLVGLELGIIGSLPGGEPAGCSDCTDECVAFGADRAVYHQGADGNGVVHVENYGAWSLIGEDGRRVVFDVDGQTWTVFPPNSDGIWTVQTRSNSFQLDPACPISSGGAGSGDDDGA